jgi:hypothetical protein
VRFLRLEQSFQSNQKWRDSSAGCSWRKAVEELTALERAERADEERSSFSIPLQ